METLQGKLTHLQAAVALEPTASVGNCGTSVNTVSRTTLPAPILPYATDWPQSQIVTGTLGQLYI